MKKIFLLTILLFQLTFVFGQKVLMEDEKVIQYDTDWGNWVTVPDNSNISFCAKLNWYDKQTKLYNWSIRRKVARTPIYYEWKIANQVFTGASDNPNNNEGYYNSSVYDSRDVANSMNGSGFSIYSSSKTTLLYQVRNVCYVFEGRNPNCNTISNNKNTNQQTQPQNDLSEYNRSKADLERQMQEQNAEIQRQNQENANKLNIWNNAIKQGVDAHNSGNYTEAKNQFTIAINNSTNESNRQNAQNYYNKSVDAEKSQAKIKAVGDLTNATVDLISYFSNRKNALRNSLSQEDGQALIDIVNSENPADYTQNIIQIFTDLGYTYRKTEKDNYGTTITMNNDVANINDFMLIFVRAASYSDYNSIGFSYHRKEKLLSQLSVLGSKLEGYKFPEIKGVPPSRREKVDTIIRKQEAEKEKKEQNVIEINKWVKDFNIENSNVTLDNISVDAIINNHIEAIGGFEKLKEVQNIVINEDYGDGYDHKKIISFGKFSNISTDPKGKEYSKEKFNGIKGYYIYKGDKRKLFDSEKENFKKIEPIDIMIIQKLELSLGKTKKFNGKDCYTLIYNEGTPKKGNDSYEIITFFFDISSGLLIGKIRYLNTKPNDNSYEIYEDYENVNGILFYTRETSFYDFNKNSNVMIDGQLKKNAFIKKRKIKLNQNLTDIDFE